MSTLETMPSRGRAARFLFTSENFVSRQLVLPVFLGLLLELLIFSLEEPKLERKFQDYCLNTRLDQWSSTTGLTVLVQKAKFFLWAAHFCESTDAFTFQSRPTARANSSSPVMMLPTITPKGTSPFSPGLLTVSTTYAARGEDGRGHCTAGLTQTCMINKNTNATHYSINWGRGGCVGSKWHMFTPFYKGWISTVEYSNIWCLFMALHGLLINGNLD